MVLWCEEGIKIRVCRLVIDSGGSLEGGDWVTSGGLDDGGDGGWIPDWVMAERLLSVFLSGEA